MKWVKFYMLDSTFFALCFHLERILLVKAWIPVFLNLSRHSVVSGPGEVVIDEVFVVV